MAVSTDNVTFRNLGHDGIPRTPIAGGHLKPLLGSRAMIEVECGGVGSIAAIGAPTIQLYFGQR
jgi:hypothetical protein